MNRMMAIVERELRKFFRSPALMLVSMVFPLIQLLVLGNAFGGKIRDAKLGLVDEDGGTQALKIREAFNSVRANLRTFEPVYYHDEKTAMDDVRNGKIQGAVIIPPQYSRRVYEKERPQIALVVDNSDNFMSSTLESEMSSITASLNDPAVQPRMLQQTVLEIVELYPYIEYMKYLLPGSLTLAMFVSVMIGGGMLYIDDKARGVHEGYRTQAEEAISAAPPGSHTVMAHDDPTTKNYTIARRLAALVIQDLGAELIAAMSAAAPQRARLVREQVIAKVVRYLRHPTRPIAGRNPCRRSIAARSSAGSTKRRTARR